MKVFALTSFALLAHQANAHGYLSQPAAVFKSGIDTSYTAIITESIDPAFQGKKWNDNPEANTKMFSDTFPNSKFKTLKAMMDTATSDCGHTVLTGSPVDVSALSSMKWQNDQEGKGFVSSHHGPCEAWIDDKRVFQSNDCVADYPGYPAEIPIDFSSCSGDCTFTFYWLAMHEANWQVYKNCAPIENGSGRGSSTTTTTAPAATTAAPAATTGPVTGGDDEFPDETTAPVGGDDEYADETTSPVTGGDDEYADETTAPVGGDDEYADETTAPVGGDDEYADETTSPVTGGDDEYADETTAPVGGDEEYADETTAPVPDDEYADETPAPATGGDDEYADETTAPTAPSKCSVRRRLSTNLRSEN